MPYTPEELEQAAADAERWLDELDPAVLGTEQADASDLRAVAQAPDDEERQRAVQAARRKGRSWSQIAIVLGLPSDAAQARFDESDR